MAIRELSRRTLSIRPRIRLLVVSREPAALATLWAMGEANGWEIELTNGGCEALERVHPGNGPDLVVLDLARGDADGLYTLRWLRRVRPEVRVMLLAHPEDAAQRPKPCAWEHAGTWCDRWMSGPWAAPSGISYTRRSIRRAGDRRRKSDADRRGRFSSSPPARPCANCGRRPNCWRRWMCRC